jgi:hypothetical protein
MTKNNTNNSKVVLHDISDLASLPEYQIDITDVVNALGTTFSTELAAADIAIAHTDEALRLGNRVIEIGTELKNLMVQRSALQGTIAAAESAVHTAFFGDGKNPLNKTQETLRQQKIWMAANSKSKEFKEALDAKIEATLLNLAGTEIMELGEINAKIDVLKVERDEVDLAARKEYAIAEQIKKEAGFATK